jgi:hypothetical protein
VGQFIPQYRTDGQYWIDHTKTGHAFEKGNRPKRYEPLPADIDNAFSEITSARADAVAVLVSGMLLGERKHLVDLAATNRLPVVYAAVHESGHGTFRT